MYFVLLCADILTLCFTGWVILIWKRCFSSCWLESLPKEKAGNFQGFFCVSCLLCHAFLKQKSQTSTYNPNQGSCLGGTQSVYQIPWKLWELWARSSFENQTFPFFFFFCVSGSKQEHERTNLSHFQLSCVSSLLPGGALGGSDDDDDVIFLFQRGTQGMRLCWGWRRSIGFLAAWLGLESFFKKPWVVFGTDVPKSLNFEGLCAFWEENCRSGGTPQQTR